MFSFSVIITNETLILGISFCDIYHDDIIEFERHTRGTSHSSTPFLLPLHFSLQTRASYVWYYRPRTT